MAAAVVGDVEERRRGPGVVEVDEAGDALAVPDAVPGAEVAVADDLAGCAGAPRARGGEARGLQVAEQAVDGGGPEAREAADDGSGPLDPGWS
jgi:hypothetical protein